MGQSPIPGDRSLMRPGGSLRVPALHLETAQTVGCLWGKANMALHRNARINNSRCHLGHLGAALQLDRISPALLDKTSRIGDCLSVGRVVGAKGHVSDNQGPLDPTRHRLAVVQHFLHGNRHCATVAQHHHTQAVTNQNAINASLICYSRPGIIVGGQRTDGRTLLLAPANIWNSEFFNLHGFLLLGCMQCSPPVALRWLPGLG